MFIIALCGRRKCGKTTVARMIEEINPIFHSYGFADAAKLAYSIEKDVDIDQLYDNHAKEEYRESLQFFAEEQKIKYGQDYFAKILLQALEDKESEAVIIHDLRFLEELKTLKEHNARVFRVHADNCIRIQRGWKPSPADDHISETELGDISAETLVNYRGGIIVNNFLNKEDLRPKVTDLLMRICSNEIIGSVT